MNHCPMNFKPLYYKRYVDDTFTIFEDNSSAMNFLNFINSQHPNIKFTIEVEKNKRLSFLDVLINKDNPLKFTVFRKKTYTGLSINFFSHCPILYKVNAIKTLLNRSFKICTDYNLLHLEIEFLMKMFSDNNYPKSLLHSVIRKFLNEKLSR